MSLQHARETDHFRRPRIGSSSRRLSPSKSLFPDLIEATNGTLALAGDIEVYGEGEPSDYFYLVVSGAVRTYKMLSDGRRQICAFHLRGEFFGLEIDNAHALSAETIVDTRVLPIKRNVVMARAEDDKEVARQLWAMTGGELKRIHAHALLLIKTAKERVAEFLVDMAQREPTEDEIELPMSRQDIADYLGLTIETVSRTLTILEKSNAISLPNSRRVVLRCRESLNRYCS